MRKTRALGVWQITAHVDHLRLRGAAEIIGEPARQKLIDAQMKARKEGKHQQKRRDLLKKLHSSPQLLSDKIDDGAMLIGVKHVEKMRDGKRQAKADEAGPPTAA